MPQYYFHIRQSDLLLEDPDGTELPDIQAARLVAIEGVRDLVAERLRQARQVEPHSVVIAGEDGKSLVEVTFLEVLQELMPAFIPPAQSDRGQVT